MNIRGNAIIKKGREISILRFHPWIFSGAIKAFDSSPNAGDWVSVSDFQGRTLGYGHYQEGSIAVRLLSFEDEPPTKSFYEQKLQKSWNHRQFLRLEESGTNSMRLVHGEGDGLPGLIIDIYGSTAVIQAHSVGMHADRFMIAEALKKVISNLHAVYYKSKGTLPGSWRDTIENEYLISDKEGESTIMENGLRFRVDWKLGQKTGFFLDQRDNRRLLRSIAKGRKVLNTFCYSGGFSVYALAGGAQLVHSIDVSAGAIELAQSNLQLNGFDPLIHHCEATDTFDYFKRTTHSYNLIVLDPPAFAKHKEAKHQAIKGYTRLNAEAIRAIEPGGIIFTFSCSQVIDAKLFYDTIVAAGIQTRRHIKVLQHLTQPADHPVSLFHPEGAYLKGLILLVE